MKKADSSPPAQNDIAKDVNRASEASARFDAVCRRAPLAPATFLPRAFCYLPAACCPF